MTKRLLIVYHSVTGGSAQMAEAAERGAADHAVLVERLAAPTVQPSHLLAADGYLFVCPENLASMSGLMKDFFDRCYYPLFERIVARPYALMVCAGSDGTGAVRQLERIALGWRLTPIAEPVIICTHAQTPEAILAPKRLMPADLARCAELGATLAAGLELGIY